MLQTTKRATFSSIGEAISALRAGQPVIVVDSEDRENEGDFLVAGELVTPEIMHFLMTYGRGQVCMPVLPEIGERLGFRRMVNNPTEANSPAFSIPIDHRSGSTGVSPEDRTRTIRAVVDPASGPDDFIRPGHSFPLIAREGGVLVRPGHTEAAIDLLRMTGMTPVGTLCEICSQDGLDMARRDELLELAEEFELPIITIDELIELRRREDHAPRNLRRDQLLHSHAAYQPDQVELHSRLFRLNRLNPDSLQIEADAETKAVASHGTTASPEPFSPELEGWIERYGKIGRRNRNMWEWTRRGIEAMTLPCVDDDWRDHVNTTKFLGVMLVVLLDDVADEHGNKQFTERLLDIPLDPVRPDFSTFTAFEQKFASLCLQLWTEIQNRVVTYPCQLNYADILLYDYQQLLNAMSYSSLLKRRPELLNLAEHDLYLPHNMYMMVLSTLDLMCSSSFDVNELGRLREAIWHAQWMGRIGNLVTTWQRELVEEDYSSGVFARAMSHGDITAEMLRQGNRSKLRAAIRRGRHERYFESQWWQHRRWLGSQKPTFHSIDLGKIIEGLDKLIRLDYQLAKRGSKKRGVLQQRRENKGTMTVLLANPRGFCAGVNMAIESLERALELFGTPFYVYHEIVHNRHVVDRFRNRGVVFVDSIDDVPAGSYLMYSAHGVSPEIRKSAQDRHLKTIDATCPLVSKVHSEAMRFARQGYSIILIGHRGHDEVVGTLGQNPECMMLVETVEDVDGIEPPDPNRVAYLTQTTLSVDEAAHIVDRLRERFPAIKGPAKEDICYATQNRQDTLKSLLPECDVVLVLGSRNSSNSNRLLEIARSHGKSAYLLDDAREIRADWFEGNETVLVTAGASAPESTVRQCVDYLRQRYGATVDDHTLRQEKLQFQLPRELVSPGELKS